MSPSGLCGREEFGGGGSAGGMRNGGCGNFRILKTPLKLVTY
jgi:hypothetical protein